MTRRVRAFLNLAAAGALALSLTGCISLLPKSNPAQLYRFGFGEPQAAAQPASLSSVGVLRAPGQFQHESAGDRILTVTGERAAYIAASRWVAPAEVLFDEAVSRAFDAGGGRVRLVGRGEPGHVDYALRLDVRNFETDYAQGEAPTVLIRVRAVLSRDRSAPPVAERVFEARVPATENRVSTIVAAYDRALSQVLGQIIAWTNSSVTA
jgi:cholesterol transport system auxiliary component